MVSNNLEKAVLWLVRERIWDLTRASAPDPAAEMMPVLGEFLEAARTFDEKKMRDAVDRLAEIYRRSEARIGVEAMTLFHERRAMVREGQRVLTALEEATGYGDQHA
ncbi:MAG: hypothetical protein PHZ19_10150 [Candidatus Thermoplasmatota archaeon]|nr:hypothetical protein [Candidatus Thermoplasmatota archaeon]